jgi:hypothetical protein
VHEGNSCDGCGQAPLIGVRYRCKTCEHPGGFDLCSKCEEEGFSNQLHDAHTHVMLKLPVPLQGRWGRGRWGHGGGGRGGFHHGMNAIRIARGLPDFLGAPLGPMGLFSGFGPANGRGGGAADGGCGRGRRHGFGEGHGHGHHHWGRHASKRDDPNRPRAEFVSDVTLADGLQVHAGETLKKVWSVKNVGTAPWPVGTRLVFVGGDLAPESDGRWGCDAQGALVPYAGPGDVVHVSMDIVVPNEAGRFRATFRLQTNEGDRFGPRVWIDLRVPEHKEEEAAAPVQKAEEAATVAPVMAAAASAPSPSPVASLPVALPVKSAPIKTLAPLPAVAPAPEASKEAPAAAAPVAAAAAPVVEAPKVEAPSVKPVEQVAAPSVASAAAAPLPSAPAASVSSAPVSRPSFPYADELSYLRAMGFVDNALNKYLLLNNKGDLQQVVQWLLANAKP